GCREYRTHGRCLRAAARRPVRVRRSWWRSKAGPWDSCVLLQVWFPGAESVMPRCGLVALRLPAGALEDRGELGAIAGRAERGHEQHAGFEAAQVAGRDRAFF